MAIPVEEARKKRHDKDLTEHGCGYWSVCDEAGHSCPCHSTAKVNQGFDNTVWENMKAETEKNIRALERECGGDW